MKTLWGAVLLGLCGSLAWAEEPQNGAAMPKAVLGLSARWTEKTKDGRRIVTVFVKNEGMQDVKDLRVKIILRGKGKKEWQVEKVSLTVPRNQEKGFDVVVKTEITGMGGGVGGFSSTPPEETELPVKEIASVEVVLPKMGLSHPVGSL